MTHMRGHVNSCTRPHAKVFHHSLPVQIANASHNPRRIIISGRPRSCSNVICSTTIVLQILPPRDIAGDILYRRYVANSFHAAKVQQLTGICKLAIPFEVFSLFFSFFADYSNANRTYFSDKMLQKLAYFAKILYLCRVKMSKCLNVAL